MKLKLSQLKLLLVVFSISLLNSFGQTTYHNFINETNIDKKCRLAEDLSDSYVTSNLDSLKLVGERLLVFSNNKHNEKGINTAYYILGDYFTRTAQEKKGLELLREAKNYYLDVKDYNKITQIYNAIGIAYQHLGKYEEACKWYEQSLKYGELAPDEHVTYMSLINLSQAYQSMEEYDLAIKNAEEYRDWVLQLGSVKHIANSFAVLGSIALDQEKLSQAIYYFDQSFKFAERSGDNSGKGHAYTNIGIAKYLQEKITESEEYFKKAIEYRKNVGHIAFICDAYLNYGGILFEQDKYDLAIASYLEGLNLAKSNKKYLNEIELLEALKEVYSIHYLEKVGEINLALEIAEKNQSKLEKEQVKIDEILVKELRESERIRKIGFISNNNKWALYIGLFVLFLGFFLLTIRKKTP
jgi:tetratricopeptide (TPR) repeat protein